MNYEHAEVLYEEFLATIAHVSECMKKSKMHCMNKYNTVFNAIACDILINLGLEPRKEDVALIATMINDAMEFKDLTDKLGIYIDEK